MQEELSRQLRQVMEGDLALTQKDIAKHAGVSQPTVSRALACGLNRRTKARARLFRYIQKTLGAQNYSPGGEQRVVDAFGKIWDGSDAHAAAIANIIAASKGLRPAKGKEKRSL
jgi:DNA-binding MurR/RpiR family transcriptional regulator